MLIYTYFSVIFIYLCRFIYTYSGYLFHILYQLYSKSWFLLNLYSYIHMSFRVSSIDFLNIFIELNKVVVLYIHMQTSRIPTNLCRFNNNSSKTKDIHMYVLVCSVYMYIYIYIYKYINICIYIYITIILNRRGMLFDLLVAD